MARPADYSFLVKPRWILSHLFVLTVVMVMSFALLWQLRRHDERSATNTRIEARQDIIPASMTELLPVGPSSGADDVEAVLSRVVTLTGSFEAGDEVLIQNRTNSGIPGYWVLSPLVLDDGTAVAVNRGWVPFATTEPDGSWDAFAPPVGEVVVTGMVQAPQVRSDGLIAGPVDAADGRLRTLSRVDVGRLQQQVDETLWPVYVNLRTQEPAQSGDLPVAIPAPDLSDGPHLSYAGQWLIFTTLTLIVYPLLLRKVARQKAAERTSAERARGREASRGGDPPVPSDVAGTR